MLLRLWLTIFISLISLFSFAKKNYTIGFSQCGQRDNWRLKMEAEMERELLYHPDLSIIIKQALDDSETQLEQIDELLNQDIDLLIVSPNEINPVQKVIEKVYKKGIPVILIDRRIDSDNYTAYIGGDNYEIGRFAAEYIGRRLDYKGNVMEIQGAMTTSAAVERSKGFNDALANYSKLKNVYKIHSFWNENILTDSLPSGFNLHPDIKAIFAFNDDLASDAVDLLKKHTNSSELVVVGVDGLATPKGGISMVENGTITATIIYPTGGKEAIQIAAKILHNEPFIKNNLLPTVLIDETNVKTTRIQYTYIETLQQDIDRSKNMLEKLTEQYQSQHMLLLIAISLLLIVILLSTLLFRAFRHKNIANLNLERQKEAISQQNIELKRISRQLDEATQAKLKFFTNISHEFRTPLTLLLGPLYDMEKDAELDEKNRWRLNLIHKNAKRLLMLINQLMDFRKIEMGKMGLLANEYDLVEFLQSIINDFTSLASNKNIKLCFYTDVESMQVWFDKSHMDKVFFNLFSNALKFTDQEGSINIHLSQVSYTFGNIEKECAKIIVEDNGRGISEEHLNRIFDRFYQIEQSGNRLEGTGIGLSLTKGLIEIHKGAIEVWSEKGKGTRFSIFLQLGNEHFRPDEINQSQSEKGLMDDLIKTETDLEENNSFIEKKSINENINKPVLLLVEDNEELRNYIKQSLIQNYIIVEAGNGKEALGLIEENELDLIITDVMMPEMDGLEFTQIVKSKVETCHIPVIMLTAKSSEKQVIEGIEQGADDYITKPFSANYLYAKIHQLIENKNNIRKYFKELGANMPIKGLSKLDNRFIKNIDILILENLNNEQFGVEFLGEKIGMSRVQLYRKIKQMTELSPNDYIKSIRLKKAIKLMTEENLTISEAAFKTGFSTPSYFSKCFKDIYKQTPREYLNEINQN
ncbi:hybrid sensor histidine kinase/response regulator transcription factor [Plebeiibacterium sediminum]|uniref:histidine kinase n=1 Tax=Plebeiibacterium sediminum TaxID=2992112 RepID=A0AAE3M489_9BACT|nr:substrate-binding domain-containing protein [Plebeiobacterium sediminum]MCW3786844.1 substrate-binding domain-containing protein [Plebeiobacterium sediminum]